MGYKAKELEKIYPELRMKLEELEKICESKGLHIAFSTGYRSKEEQDYLYEQGRSRAGEKITNVKGNGSQHCWGIAADFYRNDGTGAYNEEGKFFEKVGELASAVGLGWGGNWSGFKDRPHLYIPNWGSTTSKLMAQYGNPEKFISTWYNVLDRTSVEVTSAYSQNGFVREVQAVIGAKIDGIAGKETLSKTPTISKTKNRNHPVVYVVQKRLNTLGFSCGIVDGWFGKNTENGVMEYQKSIGFKQPDGIIDSGQRTWKALLGVK